jgi:integrase
MFKITGHQYNLSARVNRQKPCTSAEYSSSGGPLCVWAKLSNIGTAPHLGSTIRAAVTGTALNHSRPCRPEMHVGTPAQVQVFLADAAGHRWYAPWLFCILTGVRRGEALAWQWADVDLEAGTAAIRRSLVPVDHGLVVGEPKRQAVDADRLDPGWSVPSVPTGMIRPGPSPPGSCM